MAAVAGVGAAAFLLLAIGFEFGARVVFAVAGYWARRRETAADERTV